MPNLRVVTQILDSSTARLFGRLLSIGVLILARQSHPAVDPPRSAESASAETVTIEVPLFTGGEGLDFFLQCAREFEALNPHTFVDEAGATRTANIRVNLYGDPRIVDKVRVRIFEGTHPELTNADLNWWELIRNGDVLPLDEFLDRPADGTNGTDGTDETKRYFDELKNSSSQSSESIQFTSSMRSSSQSIESMQSTASMQSTKIWRETFLPGALERYTYEGKTYGIPILFSVWTVWYNKNLFEENGWETPTTYDEFFALCEKIKAAGNAGASNGNSELKGIAPLAYQGRYPNYGLCYFKSAYYSLAGRERYLAQRNLAPGSWDNAETVEALRLFREMQSNYFQPGSLGMSHTEAQLQFFSGRAAMIGCGSWLKSEMQGKIPAGFRLGAFNFPAAGGAGDPTAVNASSTYYFILKNSRQPCAALEFLRYLTSAEIAGRFCKSQDAPTATIAANKNLSADLSDVATLIANAGDVFGEAPGEGFPAMQQHLTDGFLNFLGGTFTPEQTAQYWETKAAAVRARAAQPLAVKVRHRLAPALLLGAMGALLLLAFDHWLRVLRRAPTRRISAGRTRMHPASLLFFLGPALLLYVVFVIVPSAKSFGWSLYEWNGFTEMQFRGLLNFRRLLFEDDGFWIALRNNLFIMLVIPLFVIPPALFLAACISRELAGAKFFRAVLFFPNILGAVAATLLWMQLYNPAGGPLNRLLSGVGQCFAAIGLQPLAAAFDFDGFAWLAQEHLYWALVPMSIWAACGFNMILYLAAMESIPAELYEAAEIDGASAWMQFRSITLPLLREVLLISLVFMLIGGMKAFDTIWLLTNQRPATQTHVIGTKMIQTMFVEFRVGEATAIAVLLFAVTFCISLAALRAGRTERV